MRLPVEDCNGNILQDHGARGWSISVASLGLRITDATTTGTHAASPDADPSGFFGSGHFERTGLAFSDEFEGALGAVVLSWTE